MLASTKRKIGWLITAVVFVAIVSGWIVYVLFSQSPSEETIQTDVLHLAVARTKQECLKAGKPAQVCGSITGSANINECGGHACWIVYAFSKNRYDYNADMIVSLDANDKYVVSDYHSGGFHP